MTLEKFTELLTLYERGKIPTYTEIIIGLPGETYESFCSGIGQLFEAGQHTSVIVNNCDLLVNTALASVESIEKYGIKKVSAAFSKEHCEVFPNEVQEFSDIIIATNTMENQMWVKAKLFSLFAQALHCMGLLRYFAVFLFYEKKINYADFYLQLVESFEISENSLCRQIYSDMKNRLERFSANGNALHFVDSRFGNITWPLEEGIFLELVSKSEEFFADVNNFLLSFEIEADIYYDLMKYQRNIVKLPGETNFDIELKYDFYRYFSSIFLNSYKPLEKIKNIIHVNDSNPASGWKDFAREIVWYGRKSSRNVYTDIRVKYV